MSLMPILSTSYSAAVCVIGDSSLQVAETFTSLSATNKANLVAYFSGPCIVSSVLYFINGTKNSIFIHYILVTLLRGC